MCMRRARALSRGLYKIACQRLCNILLFYRNEAKKASLACVYLIKSTLDSAHGVQRKIRPMAINPPFFTPYFSIASFAYVEQVG
jgi:hypothetical protein